MTRSHPLLSSILLSLCAAGCASAPATTASPAPSPAPVTTTTNARPAARPLVARAQPAIPLWANGAPGALGATPADQPQMTPYLPPEGTANGTAVVIYPGGGYQHLSMEKEGSDVANWLAGTGVTAFVVRYRLGPSYHHPTQLGDAQRAIRIVRARAAEWGVDPRRLGVIGFSAGGHLASTTGTHFDAGNASSSDPIERASSRPDVMLLLYPVITMRADSVTHAGSRLNLLGASPTPELERLLSNETQVTPQTPPTFIVHTEDDRTVPVQNALLFYDALKRNGVQAELHVFEHGPHGFGLAPTNPVLAVWTTLCETWMRQHGWLTPVR
jgi:acetyl esterase/lipase